MIVQLISCPMASLPSTYTTVCSNTVTCDCTLNSTQPERNSVNVATSASAAPEMELFAAKLQHNECTARLCMPAAQQTCPDLLVYGSAASACPALGCHCARYAAQQQAERSEIGMLRDDAVACCEFALLKILLPGSI